MSDSKTMIEVRDVRKSFVLPHEKHNSLKSMIVHPIRSLRSSSTKNTALDGVSFEVKEGEFFGIVGRNGGGKSTLLKMLAQIYQPSSGSVEVYGSLVPFIELGVGFNPELSGRENVYLSMALLGFSKEETAEIYPSIVEFAELSEFMDQKLKNYSSGMQVRLAFSIAIRADADILLLDEVLAVGDAAFQRKCFDYFRELKKAKKTVVLVTHDMSAIREYCSRAIVINEGQILYEGDPEQAAQTYSRLFIDELVEQEGEGEEADEDAPKLRYGNKQARFSVDSISKKLTDKDDFLEVSVSLAIKKDLDDLNIGISIKDASDAYICGTNTRLLGVDLGSLKAGKTKTLTWKIPNIFHDGDHYVNLAAVDMSESVQYDWWDEAVKFSVVRERPTPFITSPKIALSAKEAKRAKK